MKPVMTDKLASLLAQLSAYNMENDGYLELVDRVVNAYRSALDDAESIPHVWVKGMSFRGGPDTGSWDQYVCEQCGEVWQDKNPLVLLPKYGCESITAEEGEPTFADLRQAFGDALFAEGVGDGTIFHTYKANVAMWIYDLLQDPNDINECSVMAARILELLFDKQPHLAEVHMPDDEAKSHREGDAREKA